MKKFVLILLTTIVLFGWEINTHRAIDRTAIENSSNLKHFVKNANIDTQNYDNEIFEGYGNTYIRYIRNGETNGISDERLNQTFEGKPSYQKMIEAGTILEDAHWPHWWLGEHISESE